MPSFGVYLQRLVRDLDNAFSLLDQRVYLKFSVDIEWNIKRHPNVSATLNQTWRQARRE